MDRVFKALSDPTRRRVLQLLRDRPMTAGELAAVLAVGRKLMSLASPPERHAPQTRRRPNLIVPDGPTR